jgi:hypothetical protein
MTTVTHRHCGFVLFAIGALLLASRPPTFAARPQAPGSATEPATFVPYTVSLEEVVISANGRETLASYQTWALRSDGATVSRLGRPKEGGRTLQFPSGQRVVVNDRGGRKSTDYTTSRGGPIRDTRANCVGRNEVLVEIREVAGYRAASLRLTAGSQSQESFRALDFSCAPLGSTMTSANGSRSVTRVTSFIRGEPAPELFEVGADLVEGPPSALEPLEAVCDPACMARMKPHLDERDASYYQNQQPR